MPKIIMPLALPWDWSADYQKQTCLHLAKKYPVVIYLQEEAHFFLKKKPDHYPRLQNIDFYFPEYYLPFRRFELIEKINQKLAWLIFGFKLGLGRKIVWLFSPHFYEFSQVMSKVGAKVLYDCVDYHSSLNKKIDRQIKSNERQLILAADYFFVNSQALQKLHAPIRRGSLVAQGFRREEFDQVPIATARSKKKSPVIGYIGALNYRLDFKLLWQLIKNNPNWQFEFWGPIQIDQFESTLRTSDWLKLLKKLPNTSWNLTTDRRQLVKVINNFDIGIIPYNISQKLNLYSYPMKLFEYFYLGKPVVSTPILELKTKKLAGLVTIGKNYQEWQTKIANHLASPDNQQITQARQKLARQNSWANKIEMILKTIKLD